MQCNEISNYEVDCIICYIKMNVGDIECFFVVVVVNYKMLVDGKLLLLIVDQMKQIEDLICEVMGFFDKCGDMLNVVNLLFSVVDNIGGELFFW